MLVWYIDNRCTISWQSCAADETCIFSISDPTNAHAAASCDINAGGYDFKVCCQPFEAGGTTKLLGLSDATSAHAERPDWNNYATPVYIQKFDGGAASCSFATSCTLAQPTCIIGISAETNAQLGPCEDYAGKICCG